MNFQSSTINLKLHSNSSVSLLDNDVEGLTFPTTAAAVDIVVSMAPSGYVAQMVSQSTGAFSSTFSSDKSLHGAGLISKTWTRFFLN